LQGQAKIADHIKKSYSLGDLSSDNPLADFGDRVGRIEEEDDEVDNRLLEERYNREMQELARDHTDGVPLRRSGLSRGQKAHEAGCD
jgi:hypothetical protein